MNATEYGTIPHLPSGCCADNQFVQRSTPASTGSTAATTGCSHLPPDCRHWQAVALGSKPLPAQQPLLIMGSAGQTFTGLGEGEGTALDEGEGGVVLPGLGPLAGSFSGSLTKIFCGAGEGEIEGVLTSTGRGEAGGSSTLPAMPAVSTAVLGAGDAARFCGLGDAWSGSGKALRVTFCSVMEIGEGLTGAGDGATGAGDGLTGAGEELTGAGEGLAGAGKGLGGGGDGLTGAGEGDGLAAAAGSIGLLVPASVSSMGASSLGSSGHASHGPVN